MPATPTHAELFEELAELIAIPSISADPEHAEDLARAAEWVAERIRRAGGTVEIEQRNARPLVVGEVKACGGAEAPTVIVYAHLDVQPADPLDLWTSDPWQLVERDELLVARGIADDKAHLFMLLKATELLAVAGELPVNVRFAIDAEEEVGGHSVVDWVDDDERGADVALVLDGGYATPALPSFCIALRGVLYFHLKVRTGKRDLHSGMFGGAALNAIHALLATVQGVLAGPDGRVPGAMRVGVIPPTEAEVAGWAALRSGEEELAEAGARPMDSAAARDFWLRTTSETTAELNGVIGGSPILQKTVLPVEAEANLSVRLAPGQSSAVVAPVVERLLREALPAGADLELALWSTGEAAWIDPDGDAIRLALDAFESVLGIRPVLARSGGSIPVAAALGNKGIPAIIAGFSRPTAQIHSPDENLPASALVQGVETIAATLRAFAEL